MAEREPIRFDDVDVVAPAYDAPMTAPLTNTVPLEQAYIPEGTTLHIDGGQSIDCTTGGGTNTITDFTNTVSVIPPTIEHHYEYFNNVNFMLGGNEGGGAALFASICAG